MADPKLGDLDHRITIQRATLVVGGLGDPIEQFADYVTVWAKRGDSSARESFRAREVDAELDCRFTVRWSPEIETVTPKDRILLEGTAESFNITGRRETRRNQWVEIDCVRRADK
jgi:SPP1 family predicted phage head-tail adaptor